MDYKKQSVNFKEVALIGHKGLIGKKIHDSFIIEKHNFQFYDLPEFDVTDFENVKNTLLTKNIEVAILAFGLNDHIVKGEKRKKIQDVSINDITPYYDVNVKGLFNVIQVLVSINPKIKIIHFNSMYSKCIPNPKNYEGYHKDLGYVLSKSSAKTLMKYMAVHYSAATFIDFIIGSVENNQPLSFINKFKNDIVRNELLDSKEIINHLDFYINSNYVTGCEVDITGGKFLL